MDRITRKELKSDQFALEVEHGVEYAKEHRQQFVRYGGIALAAIVLVSGLYWYRTSQRETREQALSEALEIQNTQVGPSPMGDSSNSFATQADKDAAVKKALTELVAKYSGTTEGTVAEYYLGAQAADKGDMAQAEKRFQAVIESGEKDYASLAKLSLAQIQASQGKLADGEKLIRSVIEKPTALVSKEEATITLARLIAQSKPDEARKLLEPLRGSTRSAVSRAAITALSDIPKK